MLVQAAMTLHFTKDAMLEPQVCQPANPIPVCSGQQALAVLIGVMPVLPQRFLVRLYRQPKRKTEKLQGIGAP